jgi:hypothetical protein
VVYAFYPLLTVHSQLSERDTICFIMTKIVQAHRENRSRVLNFNFVNLKQMSLEQTVVHHCTLSYIVTYCCTVLRIVIHCCMLYIAVRCLTVLYVVVYCCTF